MIEQFSFESRKSKTEVISLANHRQSNKPIRAWREYMLPTLSVGKCVWVSCKLVSVWPLIGWESGTGFLSQSTRVAMHSTENHSNEIGVEDDDKATNNDDVDWFNAERYRNLSGAN